MTLEGHLKQTLRCELNRKKSKLERNGLISSSERVAYNHKLSDSLLTEVKA